MHSSRGGLGYSKEFHGDHKDDGGGRIHSGRGYRGGRGRGHYRSRGRGGGGGGGFGSSSGNLMRFKKSYNEDVKEQVDLLFTKKFRFNDEYHQWNVPDPSNWFNRTKGEPLQVESLLAIKKELNELKRNLDDIETTSWYRHTNFTNRSGMVVSMVRRDFEPEMCTQGWTKLHEILWTFKDVLPESDLKLNSVHLCEGPGAFAASLNHFLGTHRMDCSWKWKATTLNPYHEGNSFLSLIDQDKFMLETREHWCVGEDNTGDITKWENFAKFKTLVNEELEDIHLVTADGSMDCSKHPEEQESRMAHLIFCETVAAFLLLKPKGNFILKTFTTLEHRTVCLMYLLVCVFNEVNVFKPATSKSGNSEQYLVCLGYRGHSIFTAEHYSKMKNAYCSSSPQEFFYPIKVIPPSFLEQLQSCAMKFAKYQSDIIKENIQFYECMRASEKQFIMEVKEHMCDVFKSRFKLKSLSREKNIVPHIHLNGSVLNVMMPVLGDPVSREWSERRSSIEEFLHRLEEVRSKRMVEQNMSDEGDEQDEEEEGRAPLKRPRLALSEDVRLSLKHLLSSVGYEGNKVVERSGEQPVVMEIEPEDVQWLKNNNNSDISNSLKSKNGRLVVTVTNSRFCRYDILTRLTDTIEASQIMQPEHVDEYMHIASHVTPCHVLKGRNPPYFFSEDAINFAALDHLIHFTDKYEELMFMDLAGAPSKFSHYIYWKKQNSVKGWGMVRVEEPSLGPGKLMEQLAPWETFQVLGPHGGVNICEYIMIKSLCAGIKNYCPDGVHLVIGSVPSIPFGAHPPGYAEFHSKQFLLSQLICACKILTVGGMFICRTYELLTRFSAGLVYVMYKLFEEVSIIKPFTSSPTSAERFIICNGFNGCKSVLSQLLLDMNAHIRDLRKNEEEGSTVDVLEVLPVQQLFEEQFYRFLSLSNERIAKYRIKMIAFLESYFQNSEKLLPPQEDKELMIKGVLELLELPENLP